MSLPSQEKRIVTNLSILMRKKLRANRHKPLWTRDEIVDLFSRAKDEMAELADAIKDNDIEDIANECADVANFMAMIMDNAKYKKG